MEAILWGGESCLGSQDCASGLCSGGLCVGYLAGSTEDARETMGPAVAAAARDRRAPEVLEGLRRVLSDRGSDEFLRGRAADACRWLPPDRVGEALGEAPEDPSEVVRFFAARALVLAGDPRGRPLLQVFLGHPSEAVRSLARRALARTPGQGPINQ